MYGMPVTPAKSRLASKTHWVNLLVVALAGAELKLQFLQPLLPVNTFLLLSFLLPVVNMMLRENTDRAVGLDAAGIARSNRVATLLLGLFAAALVASLLLWAPAAKAAPPVDGPYLLVGPTAIDGDTVRASVVIWPQQNVDTAIRAAGVDTPELHQPKCPEERAAGLAAKAFTEAWVASHQPLTIRLVRFNVFGGRYDAVIAGRDGSLLAGALIASGHGRPSQRTRLSWCPAP